ncbi:hypothetical protein ZPR_0652 [Zunongwangia profunda SM-A87]|uniref:Uncharacterized protein n=1 Tax=Zunongwangia profunda (strain DSM 18752 / CCTCC AB 206139 / SM-A87) TaxID=655815 RepID=D5BFR3_ZUNPS|nr:hypothetical protein ZPR_0652 [Zunongwangia profunda SM-A87]
MFCFLVVFSVLVVIILGLEAPQELKNIAVKIIMPSLRLCFIIILLSIFFISLKIDIVLFLGIYFIEL